MPPEAAYAEVERLVGKFRALPAAARRAYNEDNTRKDFILPLFRALEWNIDNAAEVSAEEKVSRGWVDFSFRLGGIPRYFLETKRVAEDLNDPRWVKQAIDYAWTKSVTWALLSDFEGLRVFNAEWKEENPFKAQFIEFSLDTYLSHFEQLWWLSRPETERGRLDAEAEKVGKKAKKEPVSVHLFDDLLEWRQGLAATLSAYNKKLTAAQIDEAVLRILNRLIFIRTAEDRAVEQPRLLALLRELNERNRLGHLPAELARLFREFDATYDSDLFAEHFSERLECEPEPFRVLIEGLHEKRGGYVRYNFNAIDADVLGTVYEQYLGESVASRQATQADEREHVARKRAKRKSQGIYYTPTFVVKYIVQQTLGRYLAEHAYNPARPVRVLDMACGSGSFLIEAFDVLDRHVAQMRGHNNLSGPNPPAPSDLTPQPPSDLTPQPPSRSGKGESDSPLPAGEGSGVRYDTIHDYARRMEILGHSIYGVDKDEQAAAVARLNLMLKALHVRDKLPMLTNIRSGDSLISGADEELKAAFGKNWKEKKPFNWDQEFPEVFTPTRPAATLPPAGGGPGGGFDVIVGNPPYVRIQTLPKDEVGFFNDHYAAATGNYDIYVLFVERALQLLRPGGMMGFILPNKFMQVDYGIGLRRLLSENKYVEGIVDFKEFQVFEGATTYTCLLFLKKQENPKVALLAVRGNGDKPTEQIFNAPSRELAAEAFTEAAWNLTAGASKAFLEKLTSDRTTHLLDVPSEISRGSSSGADDVFMLVASGGGTHKTRDGRVVQIESEILRTPIYATDFGRYSFRPEARERIVFPYDVSKDGYSLKAEQDFKREFPKAYKYLGSRREELEARKDFQKWFGFSAARNLHVHDSAQLIVPLLADRGLYAELPDNRSKYCLMASGGFSISVSGHAPSPRYILGLLNSTLLFWYLRQISNVFRGGWITCTKQYVGKLPIRTINFRDAAEKKQHDAIVRLVEEMLQLQKDYAEAEREKEDRRHALRRRIDEVDAEIDQRVYALYGLTEDEIRVVEGASDGR